MMRRPDGLRSAVIDVSTDSQVRFRYLADGGEYVDDSDADWVIDNGLGTNDNVVVATLPVVTAPSDTVQIGA